MNHRLNARIHKLPECPECLAAAEKPCVTDRGLTVEREPHAIRLAIKSGEVLVISMDEARAIGRITAVRELVALQGARRALHAAVAATPSRPQPHARAPRRGRRAA